MAPDTPKQMNDPAGMLTFCPVICPVPPAGTVKLTPDTALVDPAVVPVRSVIVNCPVPSQYA